MARPRVPLASSRIMATLTKKDAPWVSAVYCSPRQHQRHSMGFAFHVVIVSGSIPRILKKEGLARVVGVPVGWVDMPE